MESVKRIALFVWDLFVYFLKAFLYFLLVMVLFCAIVDDSEAAFYAAIVGLPACLFVCWKPYHRKRLKRQLAETNREIARLEREVAELTAKRREAMFESVSFVDGMDGHEFEHWCAALLLKIGFESADVTQASGDDGVDIIAVKEGIRYAIQCKRYNSDLGNAPIQEVHAGKSVYNCDIGAVMTNVHFTAGGKRSAEATRTQLWDRDWIADKLLLIHQRELAALPDNK